MINHGNLFKYDLENYTPYSKMVAVAEDRVARERGIEGGDLMFT